MTNQEDTLVKNMKIKSLMFNRKCSYKSVRKVLKQNKWSTLMVNKRSTDSYMKRSCSTLFVYQGNIK